jgi:hypothetical protein
MALIRRKGSAKTPSRWYICGSYILDHLCRKHHAQDIDVCYLREGENPGTEPICQLARKLRLRIHPPNPQFVRVDDFYPQAGGPPSLSIDFLQLDMDGFVYVVDPDTGQRSCYEPAVQIELKIVFPKNLTAEIARKALRKLGEYDCLVADHKTRQKLKAASTGR